MTNITRIGQTYYFTHDGEVLWKDKSHERIQLINKIYDHFGQKALTILKTGSEKDKSTKKIHNLPPNVYKNKHGSYIIQKQIHGKKHYYGSYSSLKEAIKARNYLENNDWVDDTTIHQNNRILPRYIYKLNDGYIIIKNNESYGTFKSLEDALVEKSLLIEHNWSYDYVDLL